MPFTAVSQYAEDLLIPSNHKNTLQVLSIPSSTGEEPYSIAITLFESGLHASDFKIDALDVSKKALEAAKVGEYSRNSFRGEQDEKLLDKYFIESSHGFTITDQVKKQVNFQQGNILHLEPQLTSKRYDIIFCRNLLIYFNKDNKQNAFKILDSLLDDNGLLIVGHSEATTISHYGYSSSRYKRTFSFVKNSNTSVPIKSPALQTKPDLTLIKKQLSAAKPEKYRFQEKTHNTEPERKSDRENTVAIKHTVKAAENPLADATMLADKGKLDQAREICTKYIKKNKRDPQGYFLLGLIAIASEDTDIAQEQLRKSLYLDPDNHEALIHLSMLLEQNGDIAGANRLRNRANKRKPLKQG